MFFGKLLAACAVSLTLASGAWAQPVLPDAVLNAPSESRWYKNQDFSNDIQAAHAALKEIRANYVIRTKEVTKTIGKGKKKRRITEKKTVYQYNFVLAVKHVDSHVIEIFIVDHEGNNGAGFTVSGLDKLNGVNTRVIVEKPDGYTVLAIRRALQPGRAEAIYTPFTPDIDTPAMRTHGMRYLRARLKEAYAALSNVPSRAFEGRMVSDVIPEDAMLALLIIEHIDPWRMKATKSKKAESMLALANEVLVTAGANQRIVYNYAGSSAGARGLAQFMPRTYESIRTLYPKAYLIPDFVRGMNAHVNAVKAAILLADDNFEQLPETHLKLLRKTRYTAAFLAASYNWGAPNTIRTIKKYPAWGRHLPPETKDYLVKLQQLENHLNLSTR